MGKLRIFKHYAGFPKTGHAIPNRTSPVICPIVDKKAAIDLHSQQASLSGRCSTDRTAVIATKVITKSTIYYARHDLSPAVALHKNGRSGTRYSQGCGIIFKNAIPDLGFAFATQDAVNRYGSAPTAIIISKGTIAHLHIRRTARIGIHQQSSPGSKTKRTISIALFNNKAVQNGLFRRIFRNKYIEYIIEAIVYGSDISTQDGGSRNPIPLVE